MTVVNIVEGGAHKYQRPARCSGAHGHFTFSEKIVGTLDPKFDALLLLGVAMNHNTSAQNLVNSLGWSGFSKQAKRIDKLWLLRGNVAIDESASEEAAYTQVKGLMTMADSGIDNFADFAAEGVLVYGWTRNFYDAATVLDWNLLAASGVDASQNRPIGGIGAIPRFVHSMVQTPLSYNYGEYGIECEKPLFFYHWTNGLVSAHAQWVLMTLVFGVRFFQRKRWWKL